jgi:hypothetical protein
MATPPMGRSVMFRVPMPKRRAVSAWPYSCNTTQRKRDRIRVSPAPTPASVPVETHEM